MDIGPPPHREKVLLLMTRPPADRTVQDADAHRDGKITRDVVLTTALHIIDRDGADGCPCAASPMPWTAIR